tara:strand:- start:1143 stop:1610 length:468 start_codon:yes stop_codon:yes gene_type:complete
MIKKFTEQDMKNYADYVAKAVLSNIQPDLAHWYAEWHKTAKKVIDVSVLVDSQIDCEIRQTPEDWVIGKLSRIHSNGTFISRDWPWDECRPRMHHKHAWLHNNCPIEGFVVRAWFDKEDFLTVHTSSNSIDWSKIMYVEFLEVEHGYVMPWEQDK